MPKKFKRGQPVEWDASQGTVHGTVEKLVTQTTRVKGTLRRPPQSIRKCSCGAAKPERKRFTCRRSCAERNDPAGTHAIAAAAVALWHGRDRPLGVRR
jgi:hypothetical protein